MKNNKFVFYNIHNASRVSQRYVNYSITSRYFNVIFFYFSTSSSYKIRVYIFSRPVRYYILKGIRYSTLKVPPIKYVSKQNPANTAGNSFLK